MGDRHDRPIRSAALTLLNYIREIRSLATTDDNSFLSAGSCPTEDEVNEIESVLSGMESVIKDYWHISGFSNDEKNLNWKILIMAQYMENLVNDIRPEHLSKTHGDIGSEQAKKLEDLCDRLDEHIKRLKEISTRRV
jgi:pyruvate/2-oxoacid:ferredoxin oxidoreductase beta subunit